MKRHILSAMVLATLSIAAQPAIAQNRPAGSAASARPVGTTPPASLRGPARSGAPSSAMTGPMNASSPTRPVPMMAPRTVSSVPPPRGPVAATTTTARTASVKRTARVHHARKHRVRRVARVHSVRPYMARVHENHAFTPRVPLGAVRDGATYEEGAQAARSTVVINGTRY